MPIPALLLPFAKARTKFKMQVKKMKVSIVMSSMIEFATQKDLEKRAIRVTVYLDCHLHLKNASWFTDFIPQKVCLKSCFKSYSRPWNNERMVESVAPALA